MIEIQNETTYFRINSNYHTKQNIDVKIYDDKIMITRLSDKILLDQTKFDQIKYNGVVVASKDTLATIAADIVTSA